MSKRRFPLKKFPELLKNPPPDVDIMLYDKNKEGSTSTGDHTVNNPNKEKMTLTKLAKIVSDGFNEIRQDIKDINARLDNVDKRLDYNALQIEQINKRLDYNGLQIEQINKRLDYNGLQIEQINKRLDYNDLKKLPN